MDTLAGKVVVLTGASRGIGPFIARALAAKGARISLAARSAGALEELAAQLGKPEDFLAVPTDINDAAARQNLVRRTTTELGEVDILVNNAGLEEVVAFEKQRPESIPAIVNTNVIAPMMLAHTVLPQMLARRSGCIVNVASLAGRAGMPFGAVYSGSKGALAEWSISLHAELHGSGVTVSAVCPGFVTDVGMHARKNSPAPASLGAVTPTAVAEAVLRAISSGHPEILVSSRPIRLLMAIRALAPRAALGLARRTGMIGYLEKLAAGNGEVGMG